MTYHHRQPLYSGTCSYRLRDKVCYDLLNGRPALTLSYPLKILILNPFWRPVLDRLSRKRFLEMAEIGTLANPIAQEKTQSFLNRLVRQGFLERRGFPLLSSYPMVSIIIPVRNRPNAIAECLTSLKKLNYPGEKTEILVVDDASSDHTADVVSEFPVSLLKRKNRCQAAKCRNLAARQAKGEILAFTDSDCLADPLWLLELIPAFCDPAVGIVGGMVESYHREKKLDHYEQVKSSLNMGNWSKSSDEYGVRFYVPSCNLLIRKPLFSKLGGFQERLHVGEDVDLCWRMQDLGYDVEFRPVGKIYHKHRNQLMPFLRRRFDYGTSEPILQKLHREREKELWVPWKATLFLFLVIIFMTTTRIPFLIGSVLLVLVDSFYRLAQLRSRRFEVPYPKVLLSVLRSYGTTVYHYCSFISRYYLVLLLCFLPLLPWISAAIFTAHILAGGVEFFLKRPRLHFLTFLFYFTVEQLSYQLGVWWGCLKNSYFRPIGPKLVFKGHRTSKS